MTTHKAPTIEAELSAPLNDGFDQPQVVSDVLHAFPADVSALMPKLDAIPEEFQSMNDHTVWNKFVSAWFFTGWPQDQYIYTRPDVDAEVAFRHLETIMRSFQPKHEHKQAAVAWLMSRWYAAIRPVEQS